ncbi:MAG: hypothetical protein QOE28_144 [Solirubrobacteraceae bacterium]|nr:hypothetical protein [Solirubrobacteraceae bacterium]
MTWLVRVAFLALVGATFGAFFVAQRLKGSAPVVQLRGVQFFSPNGDGRLDVSDFRLSIKTADVVTADMINADGLAVRRLVTARRVTPPRPLHLRWDGRTDDGTVAPDGPYRVRLSYARQGRSVIVPRLITLDTTPPRPRVKSIKPGQVVGPQAPPMAITVKGVSRRSPTTFRVIRMDAGAPRVVATDTRAPGLKRWVWDGKVGGSPAPPGVYLVQVQVSDKAGNVGSTPAQVPPEPGDSPGAAGITVRSLAVQPPLRAVTAGEKAQFFVDSRRRAYRWDVRRIGAERAVSKGRVGAANAKPLSVRAPRGTSGMYLLELQAGSTSMRVPFLVQAKQRADLLVVVPTISWLGADPVDDPPVLDGVPDTLDLSGGASVHWPRAFAAEDGLPAGVKSDVIPLLAFLDRAHVRYDLTSDLDLTLSTSPRASDRKGVLLAGTERWVTRPLARRLRRYVLDGGHVATFGADTLRRGVTLRADAAGTAGDLLRPTQPSPRDPFGATLAPVRTAKTPVTIEQLEGTAAYGLLTGSPDGALGGWSTLEESAAPPSGTKLLAALGVPATPADPNAPPDAPQPEQRYALTASQTGKGLVIRVGLPQWTQRLADPEVAQITRNIVDLLRGATPKIR